MSFDYSGAKKAGYSNEEITGFLSEKNPKFDVKGAEKAGYSPEEISSYLAESPQKEKKATEPEDKTSFAKKAYDKTTRLLTQGTIGAIQRATVAYDIPAIVSRKYGIATAPYELRQSIFSDIETLQEKKAFGKWTDEDKKEYDALVELIKDPEKMEKFLPKEEDIPHYDVGSLIESGAKKFGVDLSPRGVDEMALRWIGFIKNPEKAAQLLKNGLSPQNAKEVLKALTPTGKEALRGAGAGTAIQYAAEAELGPIGTMAAAILGDMAPSLALKAGSSMANVAKTPFKSAGEAIDTAKEAGKKGIAKTIAAVTPADKKELQRALINDFREAGIQADAGTISGNNIFKWFQATLAQSGLTGEPFEKFKQTLTKNIVGEYEKVANQLGESAYQSKYEAGEALKTGLKEAREIDYGIAQDLYKAAKNRAGGTQVYAGNVGYLLKDLEEALEPGTFKSGEQKAVLDIIEKVKKDVMTPDGTPQSASIKGLINTKIALNDVIDYEVQGGAKKVLKRVVEEVDKAIKSHGADDAEFGKEWSNANKKFSEHAKVFRGKTISQALKTQDPSQIFSKMNTPHGINEIRKSLSSTPEGRELFNKLSRYKLEEMIGNNMINSTTKQINLGTFSKLLEKGQNKQVARSLLGEESFKRLEKLQNASGRLAETAQRFLNTSRSGVHATDLAFAGKIVMDMANIFAGNPWPLLKSAGTLYGLRSASKLLTDPEFLRLLEEAMLESKSGSSKALQNAGVRIAELAKKLEEPLKASTTTVPSQ